MPIRPRNFYVYILASPSRTLYIGMTNDLERRHYLHKTKAIEGFTSQYNIWRVVYFEMTPNVQAAIAREKQLKAWRREKKIELIEKRNPAWRDLSKDWAMGK
jgi:putative endonuclease